MVRISLTPIIDVVFILLIFFMLATNFQSFNKTDIKLSNESASMAQSDRQIYLVEFNKKGEYKLNNKNLSLVEVKNKIVEGIKENEDEYMAGYMEFLGVKTDIAFAQRYLDEFKKPIGDQEAIQANLQVYTKRIIENQIELRTAELERIRTLGIKKADDTYRKPTKNVKSRPSAPLTSLAIHFLARNNVGYQH